MAANPGKIRIDKWLWQARFFKTRGLSAKLVASGVRINAQRVSKPAAMVTVGDVLTFAQERDTRVIRVDALGTRRGPAPEAQTLYTDLEPPQPPPPKNPATRGVTPKFDLGGRPTKRDRRKMDQSRGDTLE